MTAAEKYRQEIREAYAAMDVRTKELCAILSARYRRLDEAREAEQRLADAREADCAEHDSGEVAQ